MKNGMIHEQIFLDTIQILAIFLGIPTKAFHERHQNPLFIEHQS